MRRLAQWAAIAAMVAAALALGVARTDDGSRVRRADRIAAGLRCPVCQGLSVKDSDSPTARDIRADIRRRLASGETSSQVRAAYVDRYGEWILLRPRTSGFEALVWVVPAAATAAGAVLLAATFVRWRHRRSRAPTAEERALVVSALQGRAGVAREASS